MNTHLLDNALQLSVAERLELIERLWDSLAVKDLPMMEAERRLLDERIADMGANPVAQSSWLEAKARLNKRDA